MFGPLTNVIKQEPLYTEYKKGKGEVPMKDPTYRVCVNYTTQGSHQGGPMNSYQEHFCMFSKNKTITNKYSPMVHDVVDRNGNNVVLRHAYGNNLNFMPQEKLNANMLSEHDTKEEQIYDRLTEDIRDNETLGLKRFVYSEKIFPKDEYTYCVIF